VYGGSSLGFNVPFQSHQPPWRWIQSKSIVKSSLSLFRESSELKEKVGNSTSNWDFPSNCPFLSRIPFHPAESRDWKRWKRRLCSGGKFPISFFYGITRPFVDSVGIFTIVVNEWAPLWSSHRVIKIKSSVPRECPLDRLEQRFRIFKSKHQGSSLWRRNKWDHKGI